MALPAAGVNWKLVRYLVRAAEYAVPAGAAYLEALLDQNEAVGNPTWMRWNVIWTKASPAGVPEDRSQMKFDLLNITGGSVDSSWSAGDFTTVKAIFDTYLTSLKANTSSDMTFVQYRAYRMQFDENDPGPGHRAKSGLGPFKETGPPIYLFNFSTASTGTSGTPYQVSSTVTLKTGWPGHWGRCYLPCPPMTAFTGLGRIQAAYITAVGNATKTLVTSLADADFLVCIPVTQLQNQTFHALLGVNQLQVDDVPDIQRRRRLRNPNIRTTF